MFNVLKRITEKVECIAEAVSTNGSVADQAVESIKKSNGQIPAAVKNLPYKPHKQEAKLKFI